MNKKIILGSASPRRKELLQSLGIQFDVQVMDVDESCPETIPPIERALYVAELKALAWRKNLKKNEVLICSDTVVLLGSIVMNKPKNKDEAFEMLKMLSGNTHQVITGVIVETTEKVLKESVITEVTFDVIPDEDINHYIDHYKPFDKAGAYGIQEWIGHSFVSSIKGSYNNVVGLPTHKVLEMLRQI